MRKLPLSKKILYGIGEIGETIPLYYLPTYIFLFYSPLQGPRLLSSYMVGLALFLGTIIQAISNPIIGHWSDKSTSRFGRRGFFIATGTIPLVVFLTMVWVPVSSGIALFILLVFYLIGVNFLIVWVGAPYLAMMPELTIEAGDRVVLSTVSSYFSILGIVLASVLPAIFLALGYGYAVLGLILAVISGVSFFVVFFTIKERPVGEIVPKQYSIVQGILQTFKNKTFDGYIIAKTAFTFGFYFFLSSLGYIVESVVMPGNPNYSSYVGIFTLIALVLTVVFSPLLIRYSKNRGEKSAFILFTTILALAFILIGFVGYTQVVSNFIQTLLVMVLAGLGLTSYFILPNAILSEVVDEDETMSGYRREGIYFGVQGLVDRVPTGLAGLALGWWVTNFYDPTNSVIYIRALGPFAGSFLIVAAVIFIFVPLKQGLKLKEKTQSN